jgi:hypothetical protein
MPYAVIAPGIHTVYSDFKSVERVMALYPYPKFRKFKKEEDAWAFVKRNKNKHKFTYLNKYGDTFDNMYIRMEYFIGKSSIYYNFFTKKLGYVKIISEKAIIENRANVITAELPNTFLDNDMITGHLIAIYYGLQMIGEFIDVDITVPDHSILYTLISYSGNNEVILRVKNLIKSRTGKISVSMPDLGKEYAEEEEN